MREFLILRVLGLAVPVILLGIAWRRYDPRMKPTLIVPTLSALPLLLAIQRDLRWILLGPDYSLRLYTTIEVNVALVIVAAIYSGIIKGWIVAVATSMLGLAW